MDGEEVFRERYNALRNVYEQRLEHLTASVRKIYQAVKADEVGMAMQTDPTSSGFFKAHLSEVVENELGAEREEFVHRLVNHVSVLEASCRKYQAELGEQTRRAQHLESESAGRAAQEKVREEALAELKRHALNLQSQSQTAIQEAQQKVQTLVDEAVQLKQDREAALGKLDRATESATRHREEAIRLKSQYEAKASAGDELGQKLRAAEFQAERCKALLAEEQQRSAQLSTEMQVQRERFAQAEAKEDDHAGQVKQLRSQLGEVEALYERARNELKIMSEKHGSLESHMESVMTAETRANDETIQEMQRQVDQMKEKLMVKIQEHHVHQQAQAEELAQTRAEAAASGERARELQRLAEREADTRGAVEERLALQEGETKRYQAQVQELQGTVQDQANQLFRERAKVEAKLQDTSNRLEAVTADRSLERETVGTLQGQLRGAADRLVALEQRLSSEREACAVAEADVERERQAVRAAEAAAREQEQAKLTLAQHLNEATNNIARLKTLVRTERQAREATDAKAEKADAAQREAAAALGAARETIARAEAERAAQDDEARKLSIEAAELRKQAEEQREAARAARAMAHQHEQKQKQTAMQGKQAEQLLQEKQGEVENLSTELKGILAQLEQERSMSRDRQDRESTLAQQVDTFSSQFKQLEAALQRTHDEKTSYQAAQQKVIETVRPPERGSSRSVRFCPLLGTSDNVDNCFLVNFLLIWLRTQHAAERSALERTISSLERKLQNASKEVEHKDLSFREKEVECQKARAYQERFLLLSRSLSNVRQICSRRLPVMRGQCESLKAQVKSEVQGVAVDIARMVREMQSVYADRQDTKIANLNVSFEREKASGGVPLLIVLIPKCSSSNMYVYIYLSFLFFAMPALSQRRARSPSSARRCRPRRRRTTRSRRCPARRRSSRGSSSRTARGARRRRRSWGRRGRS